MASTRKRDKPRTKRGQAGGGDGGEEKARGGFVELLKSIGVAVVLFLVLRTFLVQTFVITSGSMEDTLLVGDFLMVNRAAIGSRIPLTDIRIPGYSEPHRFDVLVFDPPHEEDLKLVKRLIGLPGDTLSMHGGRLSINGEVVEEPYVKRVPVPDQEDYRMAWQRDYLVDAVDPARYAPSRDEWGPIVIPPDHYFMLGDNRNESLDSRYWGLLEGWRLEGRAVVIYFSYDRETLKPFPALTAPRPGRIGQLIR
ncbi:MAG: signal peptidase I [Gemmatimonadota bacterium]|jgi:signal peptidase I